MAPNATQALEIFIERDQIPENLSILTYTEEEEAQDYFDAEWDKQDAAAATSRSRSESVEAIYSLCSVTDSYSVLGACTTPTAPAKRTTPRRMSNPLLLSIGEPRSSPKSVSMALLFRPSELGIGLTSIVGDPRRAETTTN
ncbi:hypothetical protein PHYPSEUDO_004105 [Phytophthora pseudosyringae]|uniref:Uncharacterized protein n=1 Tax=Phytophthora pseudosyringae TaxID=221518 RepID=A0A8T1WI18_9STRA|nr:hypothetical protein PHYPSEUDO_004105 [Phytophthora pseudosyringae]